MNHRLSFSPSFPRTFLRSFAWAAFLVCLCSPLFADVKVKMEAASSEGDFVFPTIPLPAINDAGSGAKWSIARGRADGNSAKLSVLGDGKIPASDDSPSENFFFAAGSDGGSLIVDLGAVQEITQVVSYSRHSDTRAPQVYTLLAATGNEDGFTTSIGEKDAAPVGWKQIAKVDTRSLGSHKTQHAAVIAEAAASLGEYRYLRFDVDVTENRDPFGHTFFSEIDVVTRGGPDLKRIEVARRQLIAFATVDQRYAFTIDTTIAPELHEWAETKLKPVVQAWYPKIVDMLPSEGFEANKQVRLQFLPADKMRGIPAWALNGTISMNAGWFRGELEREALGAVVHEMVHVVQDYGRTARGKRSPPGWIVEGIPDYIRWFLYEPQTGGALLSKQALVRAKHDASYRTTGNFIDFVIRNYDKNGDLLRRLNATAREGNYSPEVWKTLTGKDEQTLADEWRSQ